MKYYGQWNMENYNNVRERAVSIYRHLRSKSMPITRDPDTYWPEEALEVFRVWANTGFPRDSTSVPDLIPVIAQPREPVVTYRVRRDIMSLTRKELAVYQSKLEEVLHVGGC